MIQPMRVCASCGTEVDADGTFCPSCGQPLAARDDDATRPPPAPAPRATADAASPPADTARQAPDPVRQAPAPISIPLTWPVTLSGWLVGLGAFVGALSLLLDFRLFTNPITLVLLVLLLGVTASIFLSANLPVIAHLRIVVIAIVFLGLGVALDRVGFVFGAASAVLLLAMLAAAAGIAISETGRDRPWAGPAGGG